MATSPTAQRHGPKPGTKPRLGKSEQVKRDAREMALPYVKLAIMTLAEICRRGDTSSARVSAANAILDRAFGKPVQSHRVHALNSIPIPDHIDLGMTEAEAAEIYAATINASQNQVAPSVH